MNNLRVEIGSRFGRLRVVRILGMRSTGRNTPPLRLRQCLCRCDCGNFKKLFLSHIVTSRVRSCGCLRVEQSKKPKKITHGMWGTVEWAMYQAAKTRAREQSLPFAMKLSDIVIPSICPVLGIPLITKRGSGKSGIYSDSPTLDRVIPELGYSKENIRIISGKANLIKQDASPDEIQKVASYSLNATREVIHELCDRH